jgi:hypothetical protein
VLHTQTSYQEVSRSPLGSHKQRTRVRLHQIWLRWLYFNLAMHREYLSRCRTATTSTASCAATTRLPAVSTLHQLHRASRLVVSRPQRLYINYTVHPNAPSWCSTSLRSVALALAVRPVTPSPSRTGSGSTAPHVQVPQLPVRLVIDYFASRRLVVDYFTYAARLSASARRAARRRLLRLRHASGCLSSSRGSSPTTSPTPCVSHWLDSSRGSSTTTSPTPRVRVPWHVARLVVNYSASRKLVVDYCAYAARPGASARRASHRVAHRRLLRLARAHMPRVRVPRHVARLVVDHFAYAARPGASASHAARLAARRRLLRLRRASGCLGMSHGLSRGSSSTTLCAATSSCGHTVSTSATLCAATTCLAATPALLQVRCAPSVFRSHRVDPSSRLVN